MIGDSVKEETWSSSPDPTTTVSYSLQGPTHDTSYTTVSVSSDGRTTDLTRVYQLASWKDSTCDVYKHTRVKSKTEIDTTIVEGARIVEQSGHEWHSLVDGLSGQEYSHGGNRSTIIVNAFILRAGAELSESVQSNNSRQLSVASRQ